MNARAVLQASTNNERYTPTCRDAILRSVGA
jgi:hypothetical protein